MKITIFGSGYVGLVTGACFAEVGNDVLCVDVNADKIEKLNQGIIPIYEPGLKELIDRNQLEGRLQFTTNHEKGVSHGQFLFIAVGTPQDEDGSADLQHVCSVAQRIGSSLNDYKVVINKSTVPVGTSDLVSKIIKNELFNRGKHFPFSLISNPEFLKEGSAVADFMKPDRIVIGFDDQHALTLMRNLYQPFNRNHSCLIEMDLRSAELTKYAANALLATKISFMNEMAQLSEKLETNIEKVRLGIGADPRIGYHFIYPGCGFGGSCFPKDVKALEQTAKSVQFEAHILHSVHLVNEVQKNILFSKIQQHFGNDLSGKTLAVWGLAFKPGTDDLREAPSLNLLKSLWAAGCQVQVYDPAAMNEAKRVLGERSDFKCCKNPMEALIGADALVIVTEWSLFRSPDFNAIHQTLNHPVIFDGRNLYDPDFMREMNFTYYSIGRKSTTALLKTTRLE